MMIANEPFIQVADKPVYTPTRESTELLAELQRENLRFVHWKGNAHLPESMQGKSDIEMLVHPTDRNQFENLVKRRLYKKLHAQPGHRYPGIEDWLAMDYDTGTLLHIHTHYNLVTKISDGRYLQLPWLQQFFRHLTIDETTGWPIPTREMETIVLLIRIHARMIFKKPEIPVLKQKELRELLSQVEVRRLVALCTELQLPVPDNLEKKIERIVEGQSVETMISLSGFFYQQLPECIKFVPANRKTKRLKKTMANGGRILALVGSDGAGKSTLSRDLVNWLSYKIECHYFYLGKRPFIISYGRKIFSLLKYARYIKKITGNYFYILLIRKKINMLKHAKLLSQNNSLVICDRFPQKDIKGFFDGPKLQSGKLTWLSKLEMKLFSILQQTAPDVVFRLNVAPVIAAQRKLGHDAIMIEQKCRHVSLLSFGNAKLIDVDASKNYEQVLLDLKRKIWENI
jgi:Thymidylate kinase